MPPSLKLPIDGMADAANMDLEPDSTSITQVFGMGKMAVPEEVRIRGEYLEWKRSSRGTLVPEWLEGSPIRNCLWSFVRLADAEQPAKFATFAGDYGVLGITSSGQPGTATSELPPHLDPSEEIEWQMWHREPLDTWRTFAQSAKAALELGAALRINETTEVRDWASLWKLPKGTLVSSTATETGTGQMIAGLVEQLSAEPPEKQRELLAQVVTTDWLTQSAIYPQMVWDSERPRLVMALSGPFAPAENTMGYRWPGNSLFPVLAIQLIAALTSDTAYARCSICGEFYPTDRKPRADRRSLCDSALCRNKAASLRTLKSRRQSQ